MQLKPGTRLQSTTCDTQVVVVKAPADDLDLRCGGQPMAAVDEQVERTAPADGRAEGTLLGKRYALDGAGLELLCSKAGDGSLTVGDEPIPLKEAKALPSSD
jgi:hypothetical protein